MGGEIKPNSGIKLPEGWKYERLIECTADGQISYGIVQPGQDQPIGIPVIRVNNFKDGRLDLGTIMKVAPEIVAKYQRTRLEGGEVLLTLVGSTGQSAVVSKELAGWNVARAVAVIKPKEGIGPEWINICLQTKEVQEFLDSRANTTVQKTINLKEVREIPIRIPPGNERKFIQRCLGSLDDKIELNRKMNVTLEEMAQALFQSWFVDFDPVIDKALAAGHAIPEPLAAKARRRAALGDRRKALPAEVAALFPDRFVETAEMGWVPEGWGIQKLSEVVDVKYGKDYKHLEEGNIPMYGSGGIMKHVNAFLHQGESVLIPRKGSLNNLLYVNESFWTVDTMFFTIMKVKFFAKYFFEFIRRFDFVSMNVGSAVPSMTTQVLNQMDVLIPNGGLLEAFDGYLVAYNERTAANRNQIEALTSLRDTLLPKLISGELRLEGGGKYVRET